MLSLGAICYSRRMRAYRHLSHLTKGMLDGFDGVDIPVQTNHHTPDEAQKSKFNAINRCRNTVENQSTFMRARAKIH